MFAIYPRYEIYLIPGETLIPGGKGAFHPGIGYASYLNIGQKGVIASNGAMENVIPQPLPLPFPNQMIQLPIVRMMVFVPRGIEKREEHKRKEA